MKMIMYGMPKQCSHRPVHKAAAGFKDALRGRKFSIARMPPAIGQQLECALTAVPKRCGKTQTRLPVLNHEAHIVRRHRRQIG